MDLILRTATAADQPAINQLVRAARLNPLRLDWPNFIVAENVQERRAVGIGQLRPHGRDLELASLVVETQYRHHGIGAALVTTLVSRANGPLYLMCKGDLVPYYARFGFAEVTRMADVAHGMRPLVWIGWKLGSLATRLGSKSSRLAVMRHPGPPATV